MHEHVVRCIATSVEMVAFVYAVLGLLSLYLWIRDS